jgi:YidC/Oxa1 family membrane protein insertase
MEKNLILAIALSVAILVGYNYLFPPPKPMPVTAQAPVQAPVQPKPGTTNPVPATQTPAAEAPSPVSALPQAAGAPAKDIPIETSLYSAVITTRGGTLKSFKLLDKKYKDAQGRPLEMVPTGEQVMPFALVPAGATPAQAEEVVYTADKDALKLNKGGAGTLTLSAQGPDGKALIKTLTFKDGSYVIDGSFEAKGYPSAVMYMGDGFGSLTSLKETSRYNYSEIFTLVDGSKETENPAKLKAEKTYSGKTGYTGVTDKYFIAAVVPSGPFKGIVDKGSLDNGLVAIQSSGPAEKFSLYIGPKEYDRLKAADHELERSVNYGWFTFVAKPLFVALKFFYRLVGNWGWAIVVLTLIIKLFFAPLTHKSQKSMRRMQKLQPLFAELKEKYKGDPAKLNKEMMEPYKKHKVNPMGGCLPMLIQMPVFYALYEVLNNSIELRHAPFIFWLHDLSAKDPYYVLPILWGISTLLMQRMTPTSMDPKQNMIMMVMPVAMTLLFINLPSGLVLYFVLSNLLQMAQQLYINKYSADTSPNL